ncbi:beta-propeller domain-containing protein [Nocardioides sp. AX2bis]|uniref:beta-propeller domain-containing protein n=1 Tax=Nocardioides sp. AX2bis TaxID=2653157 RepID=UPI0012F1EAC2|nr:beta-propeller domain-containing protein [Nocardioides sp. AX2bis]VXC15067.1 Beta propeller domain-containing protein [Nocardioides sp. AX2bis]
MHRPPRLVVVPVALLALAGSFAAGTALADPVPRPAAASEQPAADTSCEDLRDHYVDAALPLVGPRGWVRSSRSPLLRGPLPVEELAGLDASAARAGATAPGTPGTTRSTASETGTTVQEEGVDEPDSVKTDGTLLARTDDGEVVLADVSGDAVRETARLPLSGLALDPATLGRAELLLAGDTLVVLAHDDSSTHVLSLDVSDPAAPVVAEHVTYDTDLVSARQHGDVVRLVLDSALPELDFRVPGGSLGRASAQEANEELVRQAPVEAWLPSRSTAGGDPEPFLDCADVAVPDDLPLGTTTVVATTAADPAADGGAVAVAGRLPLAYESADHLFLATGGPADVAWSAVRCLDRCGSMLDGADLPAPSLMTGTTHVVGFALDGTTATPAGGAEVEGVLADRWSLDEHDGVLRLALEASVETADATSVVTLELRGGALVELGRLDGIGRQEDLTSVRWFDDLAVLVTFRQVDPLHTVDLSDPARPVALGELEVPGFSSYLHPLGSQRLVGIGEGPQGRGGWGAQAGLFDVTDLTDVRRLDVVGYGPGSRAGAATDPRQLTWLPRERTVLTVVERGWRSPTAWVSTLALGGGRMDSTTTRVDRGSDLDQVRLVPLPDDRVVLVTGDGARFFPH